MTTNRPRLEQLEMRGSFIQRHIGPELQQTQDMLSELGLSQLEELVEKVTTS